MVRLLWAIRQEKLEMQKNRANSKTKIAAKLRGIYYRIKYQYIMKKAKFGKSLAVFCRLDISGPGKITFGDDCYIYPDPFGFNYVTLYTHTHEAHIIISDNVILRGTRFGCHIKITVGKNCIIDGASISDSDFHNTNSTTRNEGYQNLNRPVAIEERCYIGTESIIGKGTYISHDAIILPQSILSCKTIPDNSRVAGFPGRRI